MAVIARAASTAVPPSASTRAPAWLTAGELLLTIPPVASVEVRTGPQDAGHSPGRGHTAGGLRRRGPPSMTSRWESPTSTWPSSSRTG